MNIDKMCHVSCRAQRRKRSHPLMFWRFDDARVLGWVDAGDADQARARAVEDLDKRGWNVRRFEFVTVFTPPGPELSTTNAIARARGSYYRFLRWYVPPEGQAENGPSSSSPVITSRYADAQDVAIDAESIPAALRHLVPHARVWAIGDDVQRGAFAQTQSSEQKRAFVDAVRPHFAELQAWCATRRTETPVPDEVVLFDMMAEAYAELEPEVYLYAGSDRHDPA